MAVKRNALGRGLDSLISMDNIQTSGSSAINEIDIARISPNPEQPRSTFDEESLEELAASIREFGIIQPLTLRSTGDGFYQIISGERRYRAAKLAGLNSLPAYIRTATDSEITEMALIENIQREDLNAIEIALAFKKLIEQYNLTQERLSERVGKNRATIANFLRLLKLPAEVQIALRDKNIDMGHARALLAIESTPEQLRVFKEILKNGLSVRQVEEIAKKLRNSQPDDITDSQPKPKRFSNSDYDMLRHHLSAAFHTEVKFSCDQSGKGKISFPFKNEQELEQLISIFDKLRVSSNNSD